MSDDDIDRAVREAAEFEAEDKRRKDAIDTRNDADSFVFQTEKALADVGDKVSADEKAGVEADLAEVKAILERTANEEMSDSDLDELKAAKEKLMTNSQALFTKMYEEMQGAAGAAGADMGGNESAPEDDIIDGDYREV